MIKSIFLTLFLITVSTPLQASPFSNPTKDMTNPTRSMTNPTRGFNNDASVVPVTNFRGYKTNTNPDLPTIKKSKNKKLTTSPSPYPGDTTIDIPVINPDTK